ncbi:MAG: hypothetical protein R3E45_10890 [Rhodocyclaceae bacterium]
MGEQSAFERGRSFSMKMQSDGSVLLRHGLTTGDVFRTLRILSGRGARPVYGGTISGAENRGASMGRLFARWFLVAGLFVLSTLAHAQLSGFGSERNAPADDFDSRMKRIMDATGKVGRSDGGDCETCPQACETRCGQPGDTRCEAELRKAREKAFAACRARKRP